MKKENYIKICPKCGSNDIKTSFTPAVWVYGAPTEYFCERCGYTSNYFPEGRKKDIINIKNQIKNKKIIINQYNRSPFGKGYIFGLGKILGPFTILSYLFLLVYFVIEEENILMFILSSLYLAAGIFWTYVAYKKENRKNKKC